MILIRRRGIKQVQQGIPLKCLAEVWLLTGENIVVVLNIQYIKCFFYLPFFAIVVLNCLEQSYYISTPS